MKKSRLKKEAMMPINMFQSQLDQISDKGRDVLKSIEDYKFFVDQASRAMKNDPALTEMIQSKKKNLEQSSQSIYDVVFDIENMDINSLYERQEEVIEKNENDEDKKPEQDEDQKPKEKKEENTESKPEGEGEAPAVSVPQKSEADEKEAPKPSNAPISKPPVVTSRLKKQQMEKNAALSIGSTEGDILERFPNAKKVNDHQFIANENGTTYYIGFDSIFDNWKVFGRTKSDPSIFQRLMDLFIG